MQKILPNLKSSIKKNYFRDIFLVIFYFLNIFPASSSILVLTLFSRSRHPPLLLLVYPVLDPIKPWESLAWQADMNYVVYVVFTQNDRSRKQQPLWKMNCRASSW